MLYVLFGGKTWKPRDLDVYVPYSAWKPFMRDMESMMGAQAKPSSALAEQYVSADFGPSVAAVTTMILQGNNIDIIRSSSEISTYPLPSFHTTLVMNYLAHDHICVAYPRHTLRRIGVLHPGRLRIAETDIEGAVKYLHRGFDILPATTRPLIRGFPGELEGFASDEEDELCQTSDICPRTQRTFGDEHSIIIPLKGNSVYLDDQCIGWKLGGWACSTNCKTYTRMEVELGSRREPHVTIFPI